LVVLISAAHFRALFLKAKNPVSSFRNNLLNSAVRKGFDPAKKREQFNPYASLVSSLARLISAAHLHAILSEIKTVVSFKETTFNIQW
jgi:hypothetical protein